MTATTCIFCGSLKPKKAEHFFPRWSKKAYPLLPRVNGFNYGTGERFSRDVGTKKIKSVCGPCNNEWMSTLQESAKPILFEKISSQVWSKISEIEQTVLARWSAMTTFTVDFDHKSKSVSTFTDRKILAEGGIPDEFFLWVAHRPFLERGVSHLPCRVMSGEKELAGLAVEYQLGKFVFVSTYKISPEHLNLRAMRTANFMQIWPNLDQSLNPPFFPTAIPPRAAARLVLTG